MTTRIRLLSRRLIFPGTTTETQAEELHSMTSKDKPKDQGFFDLVYEVARLIPEGRVTSYGAIAAAIGSPGAARMVGWALNNLGPRLDDVPAHRVVNRNGMLTGKHAFRSGASMEELLRREGIEVVDDKVQRFEMLFWDPIKEIPNL